MNDDINSLIRELNEEISSHTGGGGKWPSSFDYIIGPNRLTLQTNRKIDKSGYRCLDSWGIALFHYLKTEHKLDIQEIQFVVNNNGGMWSPNDEAFKRRVSYLQINNDYIRFKIVHNNHPANLYSQKELFERPKTEIIRTFLNARGDDDKGHLLEKSFQAFLFGKGLETETRKGLETKTRTNDRLAILGEDFFKLKKKKYGVLREFPTGAFLNNISRQDQLTPTEFVDIVTLNRWGYLSVIELKLDDPKLEVMSQILDYALYFASYSDKILEVLNKNPSLNMKPVKDKIMCYVVNNRFHERFDDIFQYYSTKEKSYKFKIFKVVLGATKE